MSTSPPFASALNAGRTTRSDGSQRLTSFKSRGVPLIGSLCEICQARPGRFLGQRICDECRQHIAATVLCAPATEVATLWRVTDGFDVCRKRALEFHQNRDDPARPEVLASVADGLLEQGLVDDPIVLAALAISLGETADMNLVGASALEVLMSNRLSRPGLTMRLRLVQRRT